MGSFTKGLLKHLNSEKGKWFLSAFGFLFEEYLCLCSLVPESDLWPWHRPPKQPQQPGNQTDHKTIAEFLLVSWFFSQNTTRPPQIGWFKFLAKRLPVTVDVYAAHFRYNASDGNNQESGQPSGAYIFRPNSSTPNIVSKTAKVESFQVERERRHSCYRIFRTISR